MINTDISSCVFREAQNDDKAQIINLYQDAVGTGGCTWTEDYPGVNTFEMDIANHNIFCMVNAKKEVIGAISIDQDEVVDALGCWNKQAGKMAELARLVVRKDYQNQGLPAKMIKDTIDVLKKRGYASVHYLVSRQHKRAIAAYKKLDFTYVGESEVLDHEWYCYEKLIVNEEKKYKIVTIPNILSLLRLFLAAAFLILYSNKGNIRDNMWAIIVLILSGITDFLDGRIARKFNMISEVGKILDPIADKVTEAVIAICLVTKYKILFFLLLLFAVKELFMSIVGIILVKKTGRNNGAKWYGKVSTFLFYIIMISLLVIPNIPLYVANIMIAVCMIAMVFALIMYARLYYIQFTKNITD